MTDRIEKFIKKLNAKIRAQLKKKLGELFANPDGPHDVKKLQGYKNTYRLRVGDIRVVYTIDENTKELTIIDIDFRGNIY